MVSKMVGGGPICHRGDIYCSHNQVFEIVFSEDDSVERIKRKSL